MIEPRPGRTAPRYVVLGLLLAGLLLIVLQSCAPRAPSALSVGDPFPDFRLRGLDGQTLSSRWARDLNRPVIVNFWATWCGPCIHEIPTLNALFGSDAVTVVAVSLDEVGPEDVRAFVSREGIDYPVALDGMSLFQRLGGRVVPFTLVLDAELRLVKAHRGLVSKHTLERDLAVALEAAGG